MVDSKGILSQKPKKNLSFNLKKMEKLWNIYDDV